jgi:hypothetical protein
MALFLAVVLALIPPAAGPAQLASPLPSASPHELKTIVTVKSTPYCNALAQHFNAALVPMLSNDRVFEVVDVQLDDMNHMFDYPDYANRFLDLRNKLLKEVTVLDRSLHPIRGEIDALRQSASLSADPQAAKEMTDAASELQDAYKHQFQLSTDLTGLYQAMMNYNVLRGQHPLNGWTPYQNTLPADEKNIKVYLKFDQQRNSIGTSEDKAVDTATTAAETHCSANASPSP